MNISRTLTVLASAIILSTGVAFTVNAVTTTSPIKVCVKTGSSILAPDKNGKCGTGTTAVSVASAADVQALAGRVDVLEADSTSQDERLDALEAEATSQDGRLDAVEGKNSTQDGAIASLNGHVSHIEYLLPAIRVDATANPDPGIYIVAINGYGLIPGSQLTVYSAGCPLGCSLGNLQADSSGHFSHTGHESCFNGENYFVRAHAANGDTLDSNVIAAGPGCS